MDSEQIIGVYSRQTGVLIESVTVLEAMRRILVISGSNPRDADDAAWMKNDYRSHDLRRGHRVETGQRVFVMLPDHQPQPEPNRE